MFAKYIHNAQALRDGRPAELRIDFVVEPSAGMLVSRRRGSGESTISCSNDMKAVNRARHAVLVVSISLTLLFTPRS